MKLKRLIALGLSVAMMAVLAVGCGSSDDTSNSGDDTTKATNDGKVYTLNVHQHDPEASATGQFLNSWAAAVEEASEGRLDINVFHGGTMGGPKDTYQMVLDGTCDIGWGLQSFFANTFPVSEVFSIPMIGIENAVQGSAALWEFYETTDYMDKEYEQFHVLFLHTNCSSPISSDKKITSISDLSGKQLRGNAGPPTTFIQNLGANPVGMPIGEVYSAIEKGTINGLITDWHAINSFKFYEQIKFYMDENVGVSTYFMLMNQAKYDALPEDLQKVIDDVSAESAKYTSAWDEYEANVRQTIEDADGQYGEIYKLSDAERTKLEAIAEKTANDWIKSMTDKGYDGQAIYDKALELIEKNAK